MWLLTTAPLLRYAGESGKNAEGKLRHYKGIPFFRCMRDLVCQSGDYLSHDGTESESIYASKFFEDENFILRHTGPGCISMANKGPDTNGSQFFITFVETTWFNDKHVVIGYCMGEESLDVLDQIHQMSTETGKPAAEVLIADCGQLFTAY